MHFPPQGLIDIREILTYLASDRYMGKSKAAEYLGVSVRNIEGRKDIPHFKLGGKTLYRKSELDRYMEQHRVAGTEQRDLARLAEEALRAVCGGRK